MSAATSDYRETVARLVKMTLPKIEPRAVRRFIQKTLRIPRSWFKTEKQIEVGRRRRAAAKLGWIRRRIPLGWQEVPQGRSTQPEDKFWYMDFWHRVGDRSVEGRLIMPGAFVTAAHVVIRKRRFL